MKLIAHMAHARPGQELGELRPAHSWLNSQPRWGAGAAQEASRRQPKVSLVLFSFSFSAHTYLLK